MESHGPQHISRIDLTTHRRTSRRNRPSTGSEYTVEAIGTFFLAFTIGAAVGRHSALAPLAIGAAPMVMRQSRVGKLARLLGGLQIQRRPALRAAVPVGAVGVGLRQQRGSPVVAQRPAIGTGVNALIEPSRSGTT
jgi:hypothetical protein